MGGREDQGLNFMEEKAEPRKAMTGVPPALPPPHMQDVWATGIQIPLSCFLGCLSVSHLPSAKVRQSPGWHRSLEQDHVPM